MKNFQFSIFNFQYWRKIVCLFMILILAVGIILSLPSLVARAQSIDELEQRQADLDRQIQANQKALTERKQQIKDTQTMITALDTQIGATEKEIGLSASKIEVTTQKIRELEAQIVQKEKELAEQKENLFEAMRVMYETPQQSTVEIIVGSNSISEVVDRAQYIESLEYRIETTINTILKLKSDLENQRNKAEQERADLEKQKTALVDKKKGLDLQKNQKNTLLNQNVAEKNSFQNALSQLMQERAQTSSEIYAARLARGDITFGTSGYPFGNIDVPDPWGFLTRECTSYVAWYWNEVAGRRWYRGEGPPGTGHAYNWPNLAARNNVSVHNAPQVGAIISWQQGPLMPYGHVAIVEAVNANGTINISEMNWSRYAYSYRTGVHPGDFGSYSYIY